MAGEPRTRPPSCVRGLGGVSPGRLHRARGWLRLQTGVSGGDTGIAARAWVMGVAGQPVVSLSVPTTQVPALTVYLSQGPSLNQETTLSPEGGAAERI